MADVSLGSFSRIVVIGSSGSGKTTVARRIATALGIAHVELDAIHWGPNWVERPDFAERVRELALTDRWVIEGNYRKVRELLWQRAEAIVWLNLPLRIILYRAIIRTVRRIRSGETTHGGNRETLFRALLSPNGVPWWVLRSHRRRAREYRKMFESGAYPHLTVFEVRSDEEASRLLGAVTVSRR